MVEQVDVLICGSGSAGICAAVWLARCGVNFKILESRPHPLENGQADGVQCRTVEIFESFGLSVDLLKEAYHVLEVAFWAAEADGNIKRTNLAADTEPGITHQPHVILNQARINGLMIEEMEKASGTSNIEYDVDVKTVKLDESPDHELDPYCVTTKAVHNGSERIFRSRYVLVSKLPMWYHEHFKLT
jgi:phenol 2-monooxygenase (NADPH)